MSGVSESVVKECRTAILIKEMDLARLMVRAQQIEKAMDKKRGRTRELEQVALISLSLS